MADDLDDLDDLLGGERLPGPGRRSWPLAIVALVGVLATVVWVTHAIATWWIEEVHCGWFYC